MSSHAIHSVKITKKIYEIKMKHFVTQSIGKMDIVPIFIDWTQDFNYNETLNFNVMLRFTLHSSQFYLKVFKLNENVNANWSVILSSLFQ